jgi:large subunit ribosomal protein L19
VRVNVLIREGSKERVQAFEGVVLAKRGGGINTTFVVRKVFQGVSVERSFFLHSPKVESIKIIRRGKVRRAKLYFLRERIGKSARIREKTTGYATINKFGNILLANPTTPKK